MEQTVVMIPAKSREEIQRRTRLRVAAYCRVSTDEENRNRATRRRSDTTPRKSKINPNGRLRAFSRMRESPERKLKSAPNSSK